MQKYMLLLLLFLSPVGICAMEDRPSNLFSSPRSGFLSPMQEVQESKNKFEEQLIEPRLDKFMLQLLSPEIIHYDPTEFLRYCYNLKFHDKIGRFYMSDFDHDDSLLDKCRKIRIDGYSALGAVIIAEDILVSFRGGWPTQIKPELIVKLQKINFTLTEKDKMLVALQLYDVIPAEQRRMMIALLPACQEGNLALLPHDMRKIIVDYMIDLYKKGNWICSLLR